LQQLHPDYITYVCFAGAIVLKLCNLSNKALPGIKCNFTLQLRIQSPPYFKTHTLQ
jgi:hypothetical protein